MRLLFGQATNRIKSIFTLKFQGTFLQGVQHNVCWTHVDYKRKYFIIRFLKTCVKTIQVTYDVTQFDPFLKWLQILQYWIKWYFLVNKQWFILLNCKGRKLYGVKKNELSERRLQKHYYKLTRESELDKYAYLWFVRVPWSMDKITGLIQLRRDLD